MNVTCELVTGIAVQDARCWQCMGSSEACLRPLLPTVNEMQGQGAWGATLPCHLEDCASAVCNACQAAED